MAYEISGYVLEGIRVGQSNSPYTQTPDNYANSAQFEAHYSSDEDQPRSEYLVFVTKEGALEDATFGWTKNEGTSQLFEYDAQKGRFATIGHGLVGAIGGPLALSPIPDSGLIPLLRVGYGLHLTAIEVSTFSANPAPGTVEWSSTSGQIKLNSSVSGNVYYDGIVYALDLQPSSVQTVSVAEPLGPGSLAVGTSYVELDIERGVKVRLFKTPVSGTGVQDVTNLYTVTGALWADPLLQAPQVLLPSLPIEDPAYPLTVKVIQGQGSYTSQNFPDLSKSNVAGLGYYLDSGSLYFAQRKNAIPLLMSQPSTDLVLPDSLLLENSLTIMQGSHSLDLGTEAIVDYSSGVVTLTSTNTEVLVDRYFEEIILVDPSTSVQLIDPQGNGTQLVANVDYQLAPEQGLVQLTRRLMAGESVKITYLQDNNTATGSLVVDEQATFLVRKELVQAHPDPTNLLHFNVDGMPVSSFPPPAVFRGGRPQKLGVKCTVDTTNSTISFLSGGDLTDALPHGPIVAPTERVSVDYYITKALGGERTFTVSATPMLVRRVVISEGTNQFEVQGDQTAVFEGNRLLRIEKDQIYLLGGASFDGAVTSVTLAGNQTFQADYTDPKLYLSSGATAGTYFLTELSPYTSTPRGSNSLALQGDRTSVYRPGTIIYFTDAANSLELNSFTDFISVSGVSYDPTSDRTELKLASNSPRQYTSGQQFLNYSVRPVVENPAADAQTRLNPVLSQPYTVYRQTGTSTPVPLSTPSDFKLDTTGRLSFTDPLGPDEAFLIHYTGKTVKAAGTLYSVSYTSTISPTADNGLLGQSLTADYSIWSPDTFFYRVETMTNFRGEFVKELAAKASSGSSGPTTSNMSSPKLYEQGRKSLYFDERHLANQDIIARSILLHYNNLINLIETYKRQLDGTSVGNNDGLLKFDGTLGTVLATGDLPGNEIDDLLYKNGKYKRYYESGVRSRFYPTSRDFYASTTVQANSQNGDEVADTGSVGLTSVSNLHKRQAWAIVTEGAASNTTVKVDNAQGSSTYLRPAFQVGMAVVIVNPDGSQGSYSGTKITSVSATSLVLDGVTNGAVKGATIYEAYNSPTMTRYQYSRDYGIEGQEGQLTYVEPDPVLVGSGLNNNPLTEGSVVSGRLTLTNALTAPYKFPALYGGIEDDDGELSFPIQTPNADSEASYLATEKDMISTGTGYLRAVTTAPYVSTGSLDATRTIITNATAFGTPAPAVEDLVRILSGPNSSTIFRRVASVNLGGHTITVTPAFSVQDTNFTYEIAVSATSYTGVLTTALSGTTLTSTLLAQNGGPGFNVSSAVKPGYTVVFPGLGLRRQIVAIIDATHLQLNASVTAINGAAYKIVNSLATYGLADSYRDQLVAILPSESSLYQDEQSILQQLLGFADVLPPAALANFSAWYSAISAMLASLNTFATALTGTAAVQSDANAYARVTLKTDLDTREAVVNTRVATVASIRAQLDSLLSDEKLYDKRYAWIDSRINLESGLLAQQLMAVSARVKAQEEALKQLIKLLAIGD